MNRYKLAFPLVLIVVASSVRAAPITQSMSLDGNRKFDGWNTNNLTLGTNPGFGGFPGSGLWPAAIDSRTDDPVYGDGDAGLYKVRNGTGGGPYPASGSIYFGGFSGDINNDGGTLAVYDATPVADLKTVVFQVVLGEAWTYDLWNLAAPILKINGVVANGNNTTNQTTGTVVDLTYSEILEREFAGQIEMPSGMEDIYINLRAYQWDLSGVTDTITSLSVEFTGVQHAQLYALQLDQSDTFASGPAWQPVPEPGTLAALGLGAVALLRRRRKNTV